MLVVTKLLLRSKVTVKSKSTPCSRPLCSRSVTLSNPSQIKNRTCNVHGPTRWPSQVTWSSQLLALGIGAALLFAKAVYLGGLYDTWACGGDMRLIERLECALNPTY